VSSKRAIRRRSCGRKQRHGSEAEARAHIGGLHGRKGYQGLLNAYRCRFCGGWHVGHAGGRP
jgi:hypothetical protein